MSQGNRTALRIDWFDETVVETAVSSPSVSNFDEVQETPKPAYTEKKLMGFKRLYDLSQLEPSALTLQLTARCSFWDLLNSELKDDFIVLITRICSKLFVQLNSGQNGMESELLLQNMVRTKFFPSTFLYVLKQYIEMLPKVRVVNKKMNMQCWDDIESFYWAVVDLCKGIMAYHSVEHGDVVKDLLKAVRSSIMGVIEEHRETFTEELFYEIDVAESQLLQVDKRPKKTQLVCNDDVSSFRNLNIFPNKAELLSSSLCHIIPNIIDGEYPSVEHYLDVQFKLMREDFLGSLREGICKYLENPNKRRHDNIRIHSKVRIIRAHVCNNKKVGYLVDLAWMERQEQGDVDCKTLVFNKQLMFGSLLLMTCDNFENIHVATVLDSSMQLLSRGYVAISFQSSVSNNIFTEAFLMIESEVFFEPYHRVLKVLQNFNNEMPMSQYIVSVQAETKPPKYLTQSTNYTLPQKGGEISFPVLKTENWPPAKNFGLDQSQYEAFKLALTREFAVIQGPPGTGKTFMGIKVATTLLQNLSLQGTPMLIICQTNHALDQFLKGLLHVTKNIIRLGSQSKCKDMEPYSLHEARMRSKSKLGYLYAEKRQRQETLHKELIDIQVDIEKCEMELLSHGTVKAHLKLGDQLIWLNESTEDPIISWLLDGSDAIVRHVNEKETTDVNEESTWESFADEDGSVIRSCFSESWALEEIQSIKCSIQYLNDDASEIKNRVEMTEKLQNKIKVLMKRLSNFKNARRLHRIFESDHLQVTSSDPSKLSYEDKWRIYRKAAESVRITLLDKMKTIQQQYRQCTSELEEVEDLVDAAAAGAARVVGVTTAAAARRRGLLLNLRSPVVIVEEAAEVFEAHIVAALTHHCQHVILIGDQKQLRPSAAHYKLAKEYNIEISLFERMIRNGVHSRTLVTQRRMRPEFVELIVPSIYERLDSHPDVCKYADVRGMAKNLYFLDHNVYEDGAADSSSHRNENEARWCVSLANYLRGMDFTPKDITILTTYTGQAALMREQSKRYPSLRDVKITVVDNYQGEESRIVILSLCRSNKDGNIGFLAARNRVCVAMSRAKEGFYIFGNMSTLKSGSSLWRGLDGVLRKQDAIGRTLPLRCRHGRTVEIENAEDLDVSLKDRCPGNNCTENQ